jgi:DNA polymerase (family 10)
MSFVAKGIQVDLFFAAPDTWGSILVCRTGSKELNIWLAECARECGGKWHPTRGVYLGKSVSSRTEQEVYAAIGLPVIPPESRERSQLPRIMARAPLPVIEKL